MGKDYGLIYSLTVAIQQLVRDQNPDVAGAVEEKGNGCPSEPETSLSHKN